MSRMFIFFLVFILSCGVRKVEKKEINTEKKENTIENNVTNSLHNALIERDTNTNFDFYNSVLTITPLESAKDNDCNERIIEITNKNGSKAKIPVNNNNVITLSNESKQIIENLKEKIKNDSIKIIQTIKEVRKNEETKETQKQTERKGGFSIFYIIIITIIIWELLKLAFYSRLRKKT